MLRMLPVLAAALLIAACGYSVKALLPPHLKTIAVLPVENQTTRPGLDVQFTDSLANRFRRDGSLGVVDVERADLSLLCQITSYDKSPQAYSSDQQVNTWRVTIGARVDCQDKVKSELLWQGTVSGVLTYDPALLTEEAAIAGALGKLTSEAVRRTLIAW